MRLNTRVIGSGKDLIILHGLYGSGDNWLTLGRQLSENFRVHLPDQRNHGNSPHKADHSYKAMVADLVEYIDEYNIQSPIILGHSMGGKTAMWTSILHPEIPSSLIVVDISPVSYAQVSNPSGLINQHLNIVHAMRTLDLANVKTRQEIDKELLAYVPSEKVRQFLIKSIDREKDGTYRWKLNIDAISNYLPEIMKGIDIGKNAPSVNPNMPVLFIRGELSAYIPETDFEAIKTLYPQVKMETIFDAGHWIHAEKPEAFLNVVKGFLGV